MRATFTAGEYQATKVFNFRLGTPGPLTLSEVALAQNGTSVKTKGVVHTWYVNGEMVHLFLQDATGGMLVIVPMSMAFNLGVGAEVRLEGIKQAINQNPQISQVTVLESLIWGLPTTQVVVEDPFNLANLVGQSVSVRGLLASDYPLSAVVYELVRPEGVFEFRIPSGMQEQLRVVLQTALANADAGDEAVLKRCCRPQQWKLQHPIARSRDPNHRQHDRFDPTINDFERCDESLDAIANGTKYHLADVGESAIWRDDPMDVEPSGKHFDQWHGDYPAIKPLPSRLPMPFGSAEMLSRNSLSKLSFPFNPRILVTIRRSTV
ncbi:MAG: hypothetical protein MZU97_05520 [Bacillus subtilis]|nr:hypothetical protein [Bacillus subtilis]